MIIGFKLLPDFGTMPMNFKNKSCYYIVNRMITLPCVCFKFYTCHKPSFIKCKFLKYFTIFETLFGHVFVFTCLEPQRMKASWASLDHHALSSWWTVGKAVPFPHCHFNLRKSKVHLPVSLQQLTYNGRGLQGLSMYSSAPFSLHFKHCFLPYSKAALLTHLLTSSGGMTGNLESLTLRQWGSTMAVHWNQGWGNSEN